jgi:hypothetical protein
MRSKDYILCYQDCSMSLYTVVSERVGSMLSQTMMQVSNAMSLVRNYTTMPLSETFDGSGTFSNWLQGSSTGTVTATPTPPPRRPLWPTILWGIGYFIAFLVASAVANDAIMKPWQIRLLLFLAVLASYYFNPLVYMCIAVYYIILRLYDTYKGELNKRPHFFAFLPLRTAKQDDSYWAKTLFYLFTYFKRGTEDSKYGIYETVKPATIKSLEEGFRNYGKWKDTLGDLEGKVKEFFEVINKTYTPAVVERVPTAPPADATATASETASALDFESDPAGTLPGAAFLDRAGPGREPRRSG